MAGRKTPRMLSRDSLDSTRGRSATLTSMFSLDPTEEEPVRRISTTSQPRVSLLQLNHPSHKEDPPLKYHPLCSFSFIVKLLQTLISVICAGMYSEVGKLLAVDSHSASSQMFPNMVFSAFLIITPVILLSYLLGQKMPELLIRIFSILGGILYMVNFFLHITLYCTVYHQLWADQLEDAQNADDEEFTVGAAVTQTNIDMYIAVTVLSFVNSFLYFADVVFSIKRTLSYL